MHCLTFSNEENGSTPQLEFKISVLSTDVVLQRVWSLHVMAASHTGTGLFPGCSLVMAWPKQWKGATFFQTPVTHVRHLYEAPDSCLYLDSVLAIVDIGGVYERMKELVFFSSSFFPHPVNLTCK